MTLDNTAVPFNTAADVSSHDDSMAKIYSFIIVKECAKVQKRN